MRERKQKMAKANDSVSLSKVISALRKVQKQARKQFEKYDNSDDMYEMESYETVANWLSSEDGRKAVGIKDEISSADERPIVYIDH